MKAIAYVCGVCGGEVKNHWWETITRNGEVVAEYYAPDNLHLCDDHIQMFTEVADKWKKERHASGVISDAELAECIQDIKQLIPLGDD